MFDFKKVPIVVLALRLVATFNCLLSDSYKGLLLLFSSTNTSIAAFEDKKLTPEPIRPMIPAHATEGLTSDCLMWILSINVFANSVHFVMSPLNMKSVVP